MGHRYAILGSGRQGAAAAYDLLKHGDAGAVVLFDLDAAAAQRAAERLNTLCGCGSSPVTSQVLDSADVAQVTSALKGFDACLSAVPYRLNVGVAQAAVAASVSMCDLGGSTTVVRQEVALDAAAQKAGIAIVPDCGLAPGMANSLGAYAMELLERDGFTPESVRLYCGGLPRAPKPPLDYELVFSIEGLVNEYDGVAHVLRDGKLVEVPTLTELEELDLPAPLGRCEAFVTLGGTSLGPWTYQGKLRDYSYKTVRYLGHCAKLRFVQALGLWSQQPVTTRTGVQAVPRDVFAATAAPRLLPAGGGDLVVLRVEATGSKGNQDKSVRIDLLDFNDPATGFSAMERTTGFAAAIVAKMLARKEIASGARTPERAVPAEPFYNALQARGFKISCS